MNAMYLVWLDTHLCVPRTCYCDDTSNSGLVVALVEHATKGEKHAEKVALRRITQYQIKNNVECL